MLSAGCVCQLPSRTTIFLSHREPLLTQNPSILARRIRSCSVASPSQPRTGVVPRVARVQSDLPRADADKDMSNPLQVFEASTLVSSSQCVLSSA